MWAFVHSSQLRWRTAVRSRPRWGQRASRWTFRWRVFAEILSLCKPIVAAAVRGACLKNWRWRSWRWRWWRWRSWAVVGTRGLRLWGRLDVLPNSLKCLWRRLIVEKWTLNSRATALVDITAVSMPIACSLKTCDICGIVLCDKTAQFRVAFCCGQPKGGRTPNEKCSAASRHVFKIRTHCFLCLYAHRRHHTASVPAPSNNSGRCSNSCRATERNLHYFILNNIIFVSNHF